MDDQPEPGRDSNDGRWWKLPAIILVGVLGLAGVGALLGGDDEEQTTTQPSAACLSDMRAAAAETDPSRANPLIRTTLTSCRTSQQWLEALRRHPAAMGVAGPEHVGRVDLIAACLDPADHDAPVCADAIRRGVVDG